MPDNVFELPFTMKLNKLNIDIDTAINEDANPDINITLGRRIEVDINPFSAALNSVKKFSLDLPYLLLTFV